MTTGTGVEQWLNEKYGVESELYKDLARLITLGVQVGWAADTEIAGPRYRRSQVGVPSAETFFFSITAVLLDSTDNVQNYQRRSSPTANAPRSNGQKPSHLCRRTTCPTRFGKPSSRISATKRLST